MHIRIIRNAPGNEEKPVFPWKKSNRKQDLLVLKRVIIILIVAILGFGSAEYMEQFRVQTKAGILRDVRRPYRHETLYLTVDDAEYILRDDYVLRESNYYSVDSLRKMEVILQSEYINQPMTIKYIPAFLFQKPEIIGIESKGLEVVQVDCALQIREEALINGVAFGIAAVLFFIILYLLRKNLCIVF